MLDKTKRYLIVGLGLLGGKYALELSKAGFHVDGINRSEGHLQYALDHGYIETGKTHDFEDLVSQADHIIFGLYPTALIDWFKTYSHLIKSGILLVLKRVNSVLITLSESSSKSAASIILHIFI